MEESGTERTGQLTSVEVISEEDVCKAMPYLVMGKNENGLKNEGEQLGHRNLALIPRRKTACCFLFSD